MGSQYEVADTHNNAAALAALSIQPRSTGIDYDDRIDAASGLTYPRGYASTQLIYDALSPAELGTIMTALGVSEAVPSNEVTIRLPSNTSLTTWANYNATVVLRQKRRDGPFWKNVKFDVIFLEAL